jgi:hypothetical protein
MLRVSSGGRKKKREMSRKKGRGRENRGESRDVVVRGEKMKRIS